MYKKEHSSCGVGFLCSLNQKASHSNLQLALKALRNLEHRGGDNFVKKSGDGAGLMMDIPWEFFGFDPEKYAVAMMFLPQEPTRRLECLRKFEDVFSQFDLEVEGYREVPIDPSQLDDYARGCQPAIKQAFIRRPKNCRTQSSFDRLLYSASKMTRTHILKKSEKNHDFFFVSLSSRTIVYKTLSNSEQLPLFYKDLSNPNLKIKYALFHRRFSTNTISTWDKVQPFRMIGHNGEINTIGGNRSWAIMREKSLGLRKEELISHKHTSDSGSLNGMVEALKYRSSNHKISEIISLLVPPAKKDSNYYKFWSRAMEPWDGPALIGFCDGKVIGAHLDRNGFRPCRWSYTKDLFLLGSEAGCFDVSEEEIIRRGSLSAGETVLINSTNGRFSLRDPEVVSEDTEENIFNPRLKKINYLKPVKGPLGKIELEKKQVLFGYHAEEIKKLLIPMAQEGKEPIGSMGDTASLAVLSNNKRSLYDYFYQDFAQVTNPPLDYLRENLVTDLSTYLCRKPNIFEPRELLPPPKGLELEGPVISLGLMNHILQNENDFKIFKVDLTFNKEDGVVGIKSALDRIAERCVYAIRHGFQILVLTDREATPERPAVDSLLALRCTQIKLNNKGIRMRGSVILETGDVRNSHHLSVLMGFGATAVCPWLALQTAYTAEGVCGEENVVKALNFGLLRIMAKMGISVLRSYQGSELFTILGLGKSLTREFFPGHDSIIGGIELHQVTQRIIDNANSVLDGRNVENIFNYKEHIKHKVGENHSMTNLGAKKWNEFLDGSDLMPEVPMQTPVNIRDLLKIKTEHYENLEMQEITINKKEILETFGSGAMSFGAISAESQRDIIIAMERIGGRSNSGEGGENPYYWSEGITSSVKQIASGRFGVTAEYLCNGDEIQLKIAQGAKPGEGGQLMKKKVSKEIAQARFAKSNIDLISPPPMHDIYSIEDLKELIFELKQLHPSSKVSVKLVSGKNIGNISVGVVKAGADIIQISGGEGGTGAASLISMKHCGLPWEIGLNEVHKTLVDNGLRDLVELRVDGGLTNEKDILIASALGADSFDFGKMLLVAEGCIMARVCEKNTCPAGIATHDPKFKKRYKGNPEKIVKYLEFLASQVGISLKKMGLDSIRQLRGRMDLLEIDSKHEEIIQLKGINLSRFLNFKLGKEQKKLDIPRASVTSLNLEIYNKFIDEDELHFNLRSTDRAVGAYLMGEVARKTIEERKKGRELPYINPRTFYFYGSAGHAFGGFLQAPFHFFLKGEANDFVGKSMSGGVLEIAPFREVDFSQSLVGNTCFYGATGGNAKVFGAAGDRFAIRNSGLDVLVGAVGLHACEYMTGGRVIILGKAGKNLGAGMTGGIVYSATDLTKQINKEYINSVEIDAEDLNFLNDFLGKELGDEFIPSKFYKYIPVDSSNE